MLRAIVLVVISLSITVWSQEAPNSRCIVAFDSAEADLGSASPTASPPIAASTTVAAINVSSSREISQQPALMRVSNPSLTQPAILSTTVNLPEKPSVKQQRIWWALTAAQHSAAAFDAWSTRKSISSGNGYERNPLMRPFANSAAIYPMIQMAPLGLDYVTKRMMRSRHGFFRKTWWLPQTLATAGFAWSGVNNLRVANQK
jgi:hypothetical protein